jgi:excinuclease UvrABC nuclease subunit
MHMLLQHPESLLDERRQILDQQGYVLLLESASLNPSSEELREVQRRPLSSGIYLWTVRPAISHEAEHVVYVGRTNSLSRRLTEYSRGFQPHSVNDYKLQIFHQRILNACPDSRLALYFLQKPIGELTASENEAISQFKPLLNQRLVATKEALSLYKQAFESFYSAGFENYINGNRNA